MNALQIKSGDSVIEFMCDHCGGRLTVPVAYAGVEGPCPKCGESVVSPSAEPMLPDGVAEFVPLNRSNLVEDEGDGGAPDERQRRSGVPMRKAGGRAFVAKQRIEMEWGQDESWREQVREESKKRSRRKRIDRRIGKWFDPSRMQVATEFLVPAALFMVVGTVVFMKLNGWGLRGDDSVSNGDTASEGRGEVLAEVVRAVGGGGGQDEDGSEVSNLAAFERVRAAASDADEAARTEE